MIDAALILLSLINQLDHCCRFVTLDFEEGESGAMGYLNRMGFFDHLSPNIRVNPGKPSYSGAERFAGNNQGLVEIAKISRENREKSLPTQLTNVLINACSKRPDVKSLGDAAWNIFAELIDNVFSHSETPLDGYAALQLYRGAGNLKVAVSDSGLGIMQTLRPALKDQSPRLYKLSDVNLLVEVFRQGVSRHGTDRGCGLKGCAAKAIKYNADLNVRLPKTRVFLKPGNGEYQPNIAYCYEDLSTIWGTHICFDFSLD